MKREEFSIKVPTHVTQKQAARILGWSLDVVKQYGHSSMPLATTVWFGEKMIELPKVMAMLEEDKLENEKTIHMDLKL